MHSYRVANDKNDKLIITFITCFLKLLILFTFFIFWGNTLNKLTHKVLFSGYGYLKQDYG